MQIDRFARERGYEYLVADPSCARRLARLPRLAGRGDAELRDLSASYLRELERAGLWQPVYRGDGALLFRLR